VSLNLNRAKRYTDYCRQINTAGENVRFVFLQPSRFILHLGLVVATLRWLFLCEHIYFSNIIAGR